MLIQERAPDQKQIDSVSTKLGIDPQRLEELGRFADPDPKWSNGQWILKQFDFKNVDLNDSEALGSLKSYIEKFLKASKNNKTRGYLQGKENNLDSYRTFADLKGKVDSLPNDAFYSNKEIKKLKREGKWEDPGEAGALAKPEEPKEKPDPMEVDGSTVVAKSPFWKIYHATKPGPMAVHGEGTQWCTRIENGSHQMHYIRSGGTFPVYISEAKIKELRDSKSTQGRFPLTVHSKEVPGWLKVAQFTPSLSELKDTNDIEIGSEWWKLFDQDNGLESLIRGVVDSETANRYFQAIHSGRRHGRQQYAQEPVDMNEVRERVGDDIFRRMEWVVEKHLSATTSDFTPIETRTTDGIARRLLDQNDSMVFVEPTYLSGDNTLNRSNKHYFMKRFGDRADEQPVEFRVSGDDEDSDISVELQAPNDMWNVVKRSQDREDHLLDKESYNETVMKMAFEVWRGEKDTGSGGEFKDFQGTLVSRFEDHGDRKGTEDLDTELDEDGFTFMAELVKEMTPKQLWDAAQSYDSEFPNPVDEGRDVYLDVDLDGMAMDIPLENIIRASEPRFDKSFNGDVKRFIQFEGDLETYRRWKDEQKRQIRLFPTGEPRYMTGRHLFKGESVIEDSHEYATTQVVPPDDVVAGVQQARDQIDEEDLDPTEGFGPSPHITVLYGLGDEQENEAVEILKSSKPMTVTVEDVDVFNSDGYDVVIFRLGSPDLQQLHEELSRLPNDNQWPEYKPHMTIAYVKPGLGKKYKERIQSDLVGKNFVANTLEFSNTADDRTVVNLREGTTEVFENLSEQSPLFGVDLTEEPDEDAILGALYPVLNRTNRRVTSINSDDAGQTTALLDNGASLDLIFHNGSWWVQTGRGQYDLLSPTDQERLVKELNGLLESTLLLETTATLIQDGYDLIIKFSQYPTTRRQELEPVWPKSEPKKPVPINPPASEPQSQQMKQTGMESVHEEEDEVRFSYVDEILPHLQRDKELKSLGSFRAETTDAIRFTPTVRDWNSVRRAADLLQKKVRSAGSKIMVGPNQRDRVDVVGVTGQEVRKSRGARGGSREMTWGEKIAEPAYQAGRMAGKIGSGVASLYRRARRALTSRSKKKAPASTPAPAEMTPLEAQNAVERFRSILKKRGRLNPQELAQYNKAQNILGAVAPRPAEPDVPTPTPRLPGKGQSRRPPGAITAPSFKYRREAIPAMLKKGRQQKQGPVGAGEDTFTSDVSSTDTIPITRPNRRKRRGSVKLPGIKDAARRRVNKVYRVMGEGISKSNMPGRMGKPISVVMRPSQIEALEKKPVWSALRESGVIKVKPFKMSNEEFFEVNIDTLRREWNDANTETLLDEVGAVSPQAQSKILERVDPETASRVVLKLIEDIAEAQAEAELEEGLRGNLATWVRSQKLKGIVVEAAQIKDYILGSSHSIIGILESLPRDPTILQYLKSVDRPAIAQAARKLIEDSYTDTSGSLSTMGAPSGAALGSVTQGYAEDDPPPGDLPPEGPEEQDIEEVTVSSRNWDEGAMFELHIQKPDGTTEWAHREVVGHEGEGEDSELVYKDEAGNIMRLSHDEIDKGIAQDAVKTPDEIGVESDSEIPTEVAPEEPIGEPVELEEASPEQEVDRLNQDQNFTKALATYQQSKSENDWEAVRTAAERAIGKTGPELDALLGQFAGTAEQNPQQPQQPMESVVSHEVRARVTEDRDVKRCLRRFGITQNEAYLLQATDRAVRLGASGHKNARRLIDELANASV